MSGPIALHGGGEFLAGDETFLTAILEAAASQARSTIPVVVVPSAAARGRPELAGEHGVAALRRVAEGMSLDIAASVVPVVDAASAADPALAGTLRDAALIHLPGGDPDLIPSIYPGTAAWAAIQDAWGSGAVLAGASAGAMALGALTWTRNGIVAGLGLVPGVLVVPHADAAAWQQAVSRFGHLRPPGMGVLGLAERTAVVGRPGEPWRVVGEGEARWLAAGESMPLVAANGETVRLDATIG